MRSRALGVWIQRLLWEREPSAARAWAGRLVDGWWTGAVPNPQGGPGVAVTGLQWGGAGRTPVTRWLAQRGVERGAQVAIIGHGYLGEARSPERVDRADVARFGDEAVELWQTCPAEVEVWVGRPRTSLAESLARRCGVVLLDVAWAASAGARKRIVVVDASAPDAAWPAGPRRASSRALRQDDLVWLHRADSPHATRPPRWAVERCSVRSRVVATQLIDPDGARWPLSALQGAQVFGACGIARPSEFWRLAQGICELQGATWTGQRAFPDHAGFTRSDLPAAALRGLVLVTTKDRARLGQSGFWAVETDLEVSCAEAVDDLWEPA